jgi:hypothetical protein
MLNQGIARYKQSKIEHVVNRICVYLIILQSILCLIMSISAGFFIANYGQISADGLRRKAEYLFYTDLVSNGHYLE